MVELCHIYLIRFFFFKQKTAYEMRISDWSSDVCSSDLQLKVPRRTPAIDCRAIGTGRPARSSAASAQPAGAGLRGHAMGCIAEIGRASCRERVCQYV